MRRKVGPMAVERIGAKPLAFQIAFHFHKRDPSKCWDVEAPVGPAVHHHRDTRRTAAILLLGDKRDGQRLSP